MADFPEQFRRYRLLLELASQECVGRMLAVCQRNEPQRVTERVTGAFATRACTPPWLT